MVRKPIPGLCPGNPWGSSGWPWVFPGSLSGLILGSAWALFRRQSSWGALLRLSYIGVLIGTIGTSGSFLLWGFTAGSSGFPGLRLWTGRSPSSRDGGDQLRPTLDSHGIANSAKRSESLHDSALPEVVPLFFGMVCFGWLSPRAWRGRVSQVVCRVAGWGWWVGRFPFVCGSVGTEGARDEGT